MREPRPEELNTPEFDAIWNLIKHWDIGIPEDITEDGGQLYSHGTGNHVVAILDALKNAQRNHVWKKYKKKALQEMRPYVPGEDLSEISVSQEDSPELGGMIARNSDNPKDQWYVAKDFFENNYELAE